MNQKELLTLYDYNSWANGLILAAAEHVSQTQLLTSTSASFDTLLGTLVHTMSAEWMWRTRIQEGISPAAMHTAADFPTLERLRTFWHAEEERMRDFLATLSSDDLRTPVTYTNTRNQPFTNLRWELLLHVVLHGMQHRSETAAMLTEYGHSPGNIDFLRFVRERQT
jgi:uncharacterized damage-inducible protein DinB